MMTVRMKDDDLGRKVGSVNFLILECDELCALLIAKSSGMQALVVQDSECNVIVGLIVESVCIVVDCR